MMKVSKKQRRALRNMARLPEARSRKEHGFRILKAMEIPARPRNTRAKP